MNTCPRCNQQDETVLLDNDGEPYLCDSCWNEDSDTCELCEELIVGGSVFSHRCDKCLEEASE